MDSEYLCAGLDEREEGEIVDDDFEDISDNSITAPIISGKFVSPNEHLPAVSLSSVIELEGLKTVDKIRHRHKTPKKKSTKSYKKRRNSHRKSTGSDSDNEVVSQKLLQQQLKAAIQINDTEDRHKNSLRSRLKVMAKLDDSDSCVEKTENNDKIEQKETSDEGDSELAQLRLEALRTAVLNKFMHRKKRKIKESNDNDVLSDISVKTDNSETNKENNQHLVENCSKKLCLENPEYIENKLEITNNIVVESITPPEDDEDVLRALLLASMSKKITMVTGKQNTMLPLINKGIKESVQIIDERREITKLTVNNKANFKNRVNKSNLNKNVQLPAVKPLIINVNDSDSEDDILNKTIKNSNKQVVKPASKDIESSVEKFLKEQRAKVESQSPPIVKPSVKPKNSSVILEKSSVKLLPKVKQVEYQKLLQKLKNAEKRPRIRRSSHKFNGEGKPIAITSKKIIRTKSPINKQVNMAPKVDPVSDIKTEVQTLHKILKEIQIQKDGRLQIHEKYKVLMPIIKKINEASVERRKSEDELKRLLEEIAEMKKKLIKSEQDFTTQVNNLVQEKQQVDKSMNLKKSELVEGTKAPFTSTPIKEQPPIVSFDTSSLTTTTPNSTLPLSEIVPESETVPRGGDIVDAPLNPGDPNDIDKIYSKQKNTFPKYISPLDNVKRVVTEDPFSIICPYDVDGNCRDAECIYKHLFK